MKRILTLILLLLFALGSHAQESRRIYNRYSDEPGISAVYISPAMFRMIGRIPQLTTTEGDVDISPLVRSLDGMYILSSSDPELNARLRADVERYIQRGHFELLMEAKEDGQAVRMFTEGTEDLIKSFVFLAADLDECTFISFDGQLGRKEFETLVADSVR